ncbi:hypothetical protein [Hymenobacter nivis]|uniref:hypothetical protein n=1 Tax=Hymenobacter nivis TaxID=1850093 RepID=UPI0013A58568|nr:hypothetical protein [Hymenobacter nivis]
MTLLQKIQELGFQDFSSLTKAIRKEGLGSTSLGYIYPSGILAWFHHALGMSKEEAKKLYDALISMGHLRENEYGNVYPI